MSLGMLGNIVSQRWEAYLSNIYFFILYSIFCKVEHIQVWLSLSSSQRRNINIPPPPN
jgi:hypothetical protein